MAEHNETLKSMLQDIINDRHEQASVTMHDYFVAKTREVSGINQTAPVTDDQDTTDLTDPDAE
jgi:hypothetical protein